MVVTLTSNILKTIGNTRYHKIGEGSTLAAYAAGVRKNIRTRTSIKNAKYPEQVRGLEVRVILHL